MAPATNIFRLALAIWNAMDQRHMGLLSAGVAFYAMFAIFPGMAATIAIWGLFADPGVMRDYLDQIHGVIPDAAFGLIETQLDALLAASGRALGWTTAVSIAVALYSVHSAVAALVSGLNAMQARAHRPGLMRLLWSIVLTAAIVTLVLAALGVVVMVPLVLNFLHMGEGGAFILVYLPWVVMFAVLFVVLGLFYRWGPTSESRRLRQSWLSPGAFIAALLWVAASILFSVYLAYFGAYNRIYGSIGAVIALLMWLYISAYIVLFGAILNEERARIRRSQ
ncbi:YihY/virulence factor BrkB family protein [Albidovulum sp.]|uniref:YihY/virulence factor BrkB family protein n=1 Tax=Albidovulum sp. TaxID=1872424 RepID=UPI0030610B48